MVVQKVIKIMLFPLLCPFFVPNTTPNKKILKFKFQRCHRVVPSSLEFTFQTCPENSDVGLTWFRKINIY